MAEVSCLLEAGLQLGECPRWHPREHLLYWVDIDGCSIHRCAADGSGWEQADLGGRCGCFAFAEGGGLLLAIEMEICLWSGFGSGELPRRLATIEDSDLPPGLRFNDGTTDPAGRFVAGTVDPSRKLEKAALYSFERQTCSVRRIAGDFLTFNGLAFSSSKPEAWFSDTRRATLYRASYDSASGNLGERQAIRTFEPELGRPDGGCFDREGNYWVAMYGGGRALRLNPEGETLASYEIPASYTTMCAFGGPEMAELYVTTAHRHDDAERSKNPQAGGLFRISGLDTVGLPVVLASV